MNLQNKKILYFDCNATTPTLPCAAEQALAAMRMFYGNPSSSHTTGIQAKRILERVRSSVALLLNATGKEIVFTSGATEAIQTAVFSAIVAKMSGVSKGHKILYGATEHKAVPQAIAHWNTILNADLECLSVPVDALGQLDLDILKLHMPDTLMVCSMAVNNETGVIQDLEAIAKLLLPSTLWLVDCVQALGKLDLDFKTLRIDYACFSGHKIYAPKGIGFLYTRHGRPFTPLIVGGGQESGARSGTENLPGVASLGCIVDELIQPSGRFQSHGVLLGYQAQLTKTLLEAFPNIIFHTPFASSVPTTLNFSVPGCPSKQLVDILDAGGVRVSAGSACSAAKTAGSYVLDAMGVAPPLSKGALRLSFGPATSQQDIDLGCQILRVAGRILQQSCVLPRTAEVANPLQSGIIHWAGEDGNCWIWLDADKRTIVTVDMQESMRPKLNQFLSCQAFEWTHSLQTSSDHDVAAFEHCKSTLTQIKLTDLQKSEFQCDAKCYFVSSSGFVFSGTLEVTALQTTFPNSHVVYGRCDFDDAQFCDTKQRNTADTPSTCSYENFCKSYAHHLIIDVRESYENALFKDWSALGKEPLNVPLSRLSDILKNGWDSLQPILFLCRSGPRSHVAAQTARRVGFVNAWSLDCGVAGFPQDSVAEIEYSI